MQMELSQFTAIIGIDWADKKHDICIQATDTGQRKTYQIQHNESPRVYRRLHYLREWSYEQVNEIFPGSAGKSGTAAI